MYNHVLPTDTPSPFFPRGVAAVHGLSGTDNLVFKIQADCSFKIKIIPLSN